MTILDANGRAINPPPQDQCDHGVTFDIEAARQVIRDAGCARARQRDKAGAAVDFVLGDVDAVRVIQRRWPRGWFTAQKPCPKGCGFIGVAYASYEHRIMGDW